MQTQVARIMSVNEKTLCLSFEVRMPHSSGLLNLLFLLWSPTQSCAGLPPTAGRRRHAPETRTRMEASARRIRFGGTLQLPPMRLRADAIETLEPGTVLRLDLSANKLGRMASGRPAAGLMLRLSGRDRTGRTV